MLCAVLCWAGEAVASEKARGSALCAGADESTQTKGIKQCRCQRSTKIYLRLCSFVCSWPEDTVSST